MQNHYLSTRSRPRCRDYSGPSSQTTTGAAKLKIFEFKAIRPNSRFLLIFVGSVVVYESQTTTEPTKMKIFEFKATRPNSRFLFIFVGSLGVYDGER